VFENDEFADFNWKINVVSYDKVTNTGFRVHKDVTRKKNNYPVTLTFDLENQ
jgi:hypothetical protein